MSAAQNDYLCSGFFFNEFSSLGGEHLSSCWDRNENPIESIGNLDENQVWYLEEIYTSQQKHNQIADSHY